MSNKFNESFNREMSRFQINENSTQFRIPHNRERAGGVVPGDRIKFSDNILSSEWFRSQPENIQHIVKELHEGDLNLFVDGVDGYDGSDNIKAIIARELAPGFQCPNSKVTVPTELCEVLASTGDRATAPIPDSWRGPERVTIKPEPVKPLSEDIPNNPENQTLKADDGSGKLQSIDHEMTDKNVPGQSGGNYTSNYMPSGS